MIRQIEENTFRYQKKVSKKDRKSKAQFFTTLSIAQYMSSLSDVSLEKEHLNILDCGAGTGILTCSLIDKLIEDRFDGAINIDLYENDEKVIETLSENMKLYTDKYKNIKINIIQNNFILSNRDAWLNEQFEGIYDIVIANPPYKKLVKSAEESIIMDKVVHGQPNIYFLFMAMAIKLLKTGGEMIADNFNIHKKHINGDRIINNIEQGTLDLWIKCADKYGVGKKELHLVEREDGSQYFISSLDDFRLDLAKEFEHKFLGEFLYQLENRDKITWSDEYDYIVGFIRL